MKDLFKLLKVHCEDWFDHVMDGFENYPFWSVIVTVSVSLWTILMFQSKKKCNKNKVLDWVDKV